MNNNLRCFYRTVTPNHFIFGSHHAFILHVAGEAYVPVFQTAKLRSDEEVYKSHCKRVANYNIWQSCFKKHIQEQARIFSAAFGWLVSVSGPLSLLQGRTHKQKPPKPTIPLLGLQIRFILVSNEIEGGCESTQGMFLVNITVDSIAKCFSSLHSLRDNYIINSVFHMLMYI